MPCWWLSADEGAADPDWLARALAECKLQGKGLIARFDGVGDRDAAEKLAGHYVGVPREQWPETAESEFYWSDLVGLEVVNLSGERLGRVAGLLRTGAHEVLDVRDADGSRRLLPFVAAVIKEVDLAGRRIRVDWGRDW